MVLTILTLLCSIPGIFLSLYCNLENWQDALKGYVGTGIFISLITFFTLWIIHFCSKVINARIENKKVFLIPGYISYLAVIAFILFDSRNQIWNKDLILELVYEASYGLFIDSLYIALFLLAVRKKTTPVSFDEYVLKNITSNKPNTENLVVTINNLRKPEFYSDCAEDEAVFYHYYASILEECSNEAKKVIFERHFENETTGHWYVSRVDIFRNNGFEPELKVYMNFISKTVKENSFRGIPLTDSVHLKDYCCVICNFKYRYFDEAEKFVFTNTELEF